MFRLAGMAKKVDFGDIITVEDAYNLMRSTENNVNNPNAENFTIGYLEGMYPEYSNAINMIIDVWNEFGL